MFEPEDDLLPVSALQHFVFCPRRAALVHVEGLWSENRYTAEGRVVHDRVHDGTQSESRSGVRFARGLEIRSAKLRLSGKADLVEFYMQTGKVIPVEYKRGTAKACSTEFRIQLCAQALCLEEMLSVAIPTGAIYFARSRKRVSVELDAALRSETLAAIHALHQLIASKQTPKAFVDRRCGKCSLRNLCLPKAQRPKETASKYLRDVIMGNVGADWGPSQ